MPINRRRAPSSQISRAKKLGGHSTEDEYAQLIGGTTIPGSRKQDVTARDSSLHSVKSLKKWQIFSYRHETIAKSVYLNILQPCLDAIESDRDKYVADREKCIGYKETFIKQHTREKAKQLTNEDVIRAVGANTYIESKIRLSQTTAAVCSALRDKSFLRNFLGEAMFDNDGVTFFVAHDSTYKKDHVFKVFHRDDVLDILTAQFSPSVSTAGRTPEDFNVGGQKTLLRGLGSRNREKNIVEIEVRNDGPQHFRELQFNMHSRDVLSLLLGGDCPLPSKQFCKGVMLYGKAVDSSF
jgi:hypothetical protein